MTCFKSFIAVLAIGVLASLLPSCASTNMSTQINPEFHHYELKKSMAVAIITDLELEKHLEQQLREEFAKYGIDCVPSWAVLFRGTKYSDDQIDSILASNNIASILFIRPNQYGVTTSYTPTNTVTSTKGSVSTDPFGNARFYGRTESYTYGGQKIEKPWGSFDIELVDAATWKTVWLATANSSGNALANTKTLHSSLASKAVSMLKKDGIITNSKL